MANAAIEHVSDTAIWVAYYRAEETDRPDALFKDPLARLLIGDRGEAIANSMETTKYAQQNVVMRTYIIDNFLKELVAKGVDTVINIGAGLDTRPYRLDLPASLTWIEIDFPDVLQSKAKVLHDQVPRLKLERMPMDLTNRDLRRKAFKDISIRSKKVAVLTEGVLPYLSEEDVASLAEDLHENSAFEFWICDYMSPRIYKYIQTRERQTKLKNAPFRFFPADPFAFFSERGWKREEIRYIQKTTVDLGRPMPVPFMARIMAPFMPRAVREGFLQASGYMILKRS